MRVRSTFGTCEMYMLYYTNMSHCDPGLLQDWEYHACWWECRGRQPFAGARGVLASSFLLAAAGGKKGVQRATALCRSARCPRFILPSRRRRRQKGSAEGDSPLPEREVSSLHPSFP